jgi:DNA-binding response OmpR family regulator
MRKAKLVLIDDDVEFLSEVKEMMNSSGYEIVCMSDTEYGIDKLRAARPDVILLDIKMRIRSGLQIALEIKRDQMLRCIPIIAMSAVYIENDVLGICGIKDRLMKPFFPTEVVSKVESILNVT